MDSKHLKEYYNVININEKYKSITPEIVTFYKKEYKRLFKIYKNKDVVLNLLYKKILKKYIDAHKESYLMEKIYVKTKLGSYLSGGCGIGPSLLTSLIGSSIFTYMNNLIERLNSPLTLIYCSMATALAIYLLTIQDNQVEMYNLFLEIIENLEKENTDIKSKKTHHNI